MLGRAGGGGYGMSLKGHREVEFVGLGVKDLVMRWGGGGGMRQRGVMWGGGSGWVGWCLFAMRGTATNLLQNWRDTFCY